MRYLTCLIPLSLLLCSCLTHSSNPSPAHSTHPAQSNRPSYRCTGNEPFWNATIRGNEISYSSFYPEEKMTYALKGVNVAGKVQTFTGEGSAGSIIITLKEETSNDTMSDKIYPYSAKVRINDRAQRRGAAEIIE